MDIVLCDISALEYWRSIDPRSPSIRSAAQSSGLPAKAPTRNDIEALDLRTHGILSRPVHLLVAAGTGRAPTPSAVYHACKSVPERSLIEIGDGIMITSAALSFSRLGASQSLVELIVVGYELTGTYALSSQTPQGFVKQAPLTSAEELETLANALGDAPGIKRARRAARYLLPGSASPAETELSALFHLPCSLGGYGLKPARLNHRIELDRQAQALASKSHVRCDLCWPEANLCIEYDSDAEHTGSVRIARDSKRRNALVSMGFTVITVTKRQMYSSLEMDGIAQAVAKKLGTRIRPSVPDFEDRKFKLRAELLGDPFGNVRQWR